MQQSQPVADASGSEADRLIDALVREIDAQGRPYLVTTDLDSLACARTILELPRERQVPVVLEAVARQTAQMNRLGAPDGGSPAQFSVQHFMALKALISVLLRKNLPFGIEDVERLLQAAAGGRGYYAWQLSLGGILRALENVCRVGGVPDRLRPGVIAFRDRLQARGSHAEARNAVKRLDELLAPPPAADPHIQLGADEAWTCYLQERLDKLQPAARPAWQALLLHCKTAAQSKPSGKWLRQAEALVGGVGAAAFADVTGGTLSEIGKPGAPRFQQIFGQEFALDPTLVHETHADLLRGLVWCTSLVNDDGLTAAVGDAAAACFKKIPGVGPRAPKIGNACLVALAAMSSSAAVGQLGRLKSRAKHASVRKQLGRALDTAADKTGLTADEMEEVSVPTCGLTEVGARRVQLGDITAALEIPGIKAELTWHRADGKTLKSVPAALKESFAADLKSLKQSEKEIGTLLPGQRDRLEQLFLQERSWSLAEYRSRYLDHPLVGVLARRLIWRFTDGTNACDGIWLDGKIVDEQGRSLDWLGDGARVVPWHPLGCAPERVLAWRDWLERHQVRQPFKQAHREIYVLTDAERQTNTYSNRFAAHIIRQHQFSALCQQRGWRYTLQGDWDSHNIPALQLARWGLRVEFWVQPIEDREQLGHSGIFIYLSTDQVRFYRRDEHQPMPLADVPLLVFSEALRDVDLFVGVASVGNDPNWADTTAGRYRDYWQRFSFGDLSATAQTRKAVLERVVPRLKIADRCSFADKFLVVRGDLHTYRIHLGSGNILMSPNDQYLCILPKPASGAGAKVFLPFEGDNVLSVILSKAFLLAEDAKIKDPTIVSQIGKRQ
jgi:hypothetical protein